MREGVLRGYDLVRCGHVLPTRFIQRRKRGYVIIITIVNTLNDIMRIIIYLGTISMFIIRKY